MPAYREFNFSPSGQWAAYGFSGYRQRDASLVFAKAPAMSLRRLPERLELDAVLNPALLPRCALGETLELGLAAVI